MPLNAYRFAFGFAALLAALVVGRGLTDTPPKEKPAEETPSAGQDSPPDFPSELIDEAFRAHVAPEFLRQAVSTLHPGRLTDAALQVLEGERILGRPNRAVPAAKLIELAIRAAGEAGDKESLSRLDRRVQEAGSKELQARVKTLIELARPSRSGDPVAKLGLEQQGEDAVELFRLVLSDINAARMLKNQGALDGLEQGLKTLAGLNDKQLDYLRTQIRQARKSLPETNDEADETLIKLSRMSRATATVGTRIVNYCASKFNSRIVVMTGECAELAGTALVNSGVAYTKFMGGTNVDYVWGTLKRLVTPKNNLTGEAQPGDVVQYRSTKFVGGGGAEHHTSVIKSVERNGSYLRVYESNTNNGTIKYATEGIVDLNGLTAGKIWIYRPQPATAAYIFRIGITNKTNRDISFGFGGKSYKIKAGASNEYTADTTTGNVVASYTLTLGNNEIGQGFNAEAQRKYEFRGSGNSYSLQASGWVTGFAYRP
jgi:hypothetical protein